MRKALTPILLSLSLLCGCAEDTLRNGIYSASAPGYTGRPVTATILVEEGALTQIVINCSEESAGVGSDKGPALANLLLRDGVPGRVDVITGATITSRAAKKAFKRARRAAAGRDSLPLLERLFDGEKEFKK